MRINPRADIIAIFLSQTAYLAVAVSIFRYLADSQIKQISSDTIGIYHNELRKNIFKKTCNI